MLRLLILISILIFSPRHCFAASPLIIEAKVKDSHKDDIPEFTVVTKIKNASDSAQTIMIWSGCYGWSWIADRPEIVTGLDSCLQNNSGKIELKPHEEYVREIKIAIKSKPIKKAITFQLGFTPKADLIGTRIGIIPKSELPSSIIWTNEMTINITPEMIKHLVPPSIELVEKSKRLFCASYPCKK